MGSKKLFTLKSVSKLCMIPQFCFLQLTIYFMFLLAKLEYENIGIQQYWMTITFSCWVLKQKDVQKKI